MSDHKTVVYTQPGWGACHQETEFLSQKGVEFTEKDIQSDPEALQELLQMNSQATPTTVIDGEVIVGFAKKQISEKLGL